MSDWKTDWVIEHMEEGELLILFNIYMRKWKEKMRVYQASEIIAIPVLNWLGHATFHDKSQVWLHSVLVCRVCPTATASSSINNSWKPAKGRHCMKYAPYHIMACHRSSILKGTYFYLCYACFIWESDLRLSLKMFLKELQKTWTQNAEIYPIEKETIFSAWC